MLAEELEHACPRQSARKSGGLLCGACLPQPGQQPGHGPRVVERDVGGGPAHGADISAEVVRRGRRGRNSAEVAAGGGVFVELGGVTVQTPSGGSIPERGLVSRGDVGGGRGPEFCRGDLALPVLSAVLIEVIREPV